MHKEREISTAFGRWGAAMSWTRCEQKVGDSEAGSGHLCPSKSQAVIKPVDNGYLLWKLPNELQDCYPEPKQYYRKYCKLN